LTPTAWNPVEIEANGEAVVGAVLEDAELASSKTSFRPAAVLAAGRTDHLQSADTRGQLNATPTAALGHELGEEQDAQDVGREACFGVVALVMSAPATLLRSF
jgi:hypothetical protein